MGKQNKEKSNCLSFSRFQNVLQIVVQLSCHVTRQLFDFPHYLRQDERRRGRREEGREGDIAASQPAGWPRARTMVIWNTYLLMEHLLTQGTLTYSSIIHGLSVGVYPLVRLVSSVPKKATQRNWAAAILTLISVPYAMVYHSIP